MNEERDEGQVRPTAILCQRTGVQVPVKEHARCPYCFGREAEVRDGVHRRFCDYRPEVDPVHFGFPGYATRDING